MITLNNKKFAEKGDNIEGCIGYATRYKRQVKFFNLDKKLIGVINKWGVLARASLIGGKVWYSYGELDLVGEFESYSKRKEDIEAIAIDQEFINDNTVFSFK